jgi:hypothetical protein
MVVTQAHMHARKKCSCCGKPLLDCIIVSTEEDALEGTQWRMFCFDCAEEIPITEIKENYYQYKKAEDYHL